LLKHESCSYLYTLYNVTDVKWKI